MQKGILSEGLFLTQILAIPSAVRQAKVYEYKIQKFVQAAGEVRQPGGAQAAAQRGERGGQGAEGQAAEQERDGGLLQGEQSGHALCSNVLIAAMI